VAAHGVAEGRGEHLLEGQPPITEAELAAVRDE
jgi:hypothetical protein